MKRQQRCFKRNAVSHRVSGSITLYLALVLILVLVLLCTLIESGRVNALQARAEGVTYMGLDSVFSEYALPVFEDYGVMMLWCKEEEFINRLEGYVTKNLDLTGSSLMPAADLFGLRYRKSELLERKRPSDENGSLFAEQVGEYMKYYLVEEAAEKLLENADLFDQGKRMQGFMEKINKHQKVFTEVEKSVGKIKDKISNVQKKAADPARYLHKMSDALEKFERTEDETFLNDVYTNENELIASRYALSDALDGVVKATEDYHEKTRTAKVAAEEIEAELSVEEGSLPEEVCQALAEEVADLKQKSGDETADFYRVEENKAVAEACKQKVDSLDGLFSALDGGISKENIGEIRAITEAYEQSFADFDLAGLAVSYDTEKTEKQSSAFLSVIKELFSKGILSYVAGEIPDKKVVLKSLPSEEAGEGENASGTEGVIRQGTEKAVFSEYIRMHFGRFTKQKEDTALAYETEYLLSGKASDKENLNVVVDRIVLIRTGLNLISLFKDPEKKAEAYALATAIIGFTGMPVLIKVMQLLILHAWSMAEALVDMKVLLHGEKVPLIKQSGEWALSLHAVQTFSAAAIEGKGSKTGSTYEDYLRMLLLAQKKEQQILRTLDLIQFNMQKRENEAFLIRDCIVSVNIEAAYEAAPLFVTFPFVKHYAGAAEGAYGFQTKQMYCY